MPQDFGQNSDGGISDFQISGQFLIKENCYNSRTRDDIDMKIEPVTKLDKRNKTKLQNLAMTPCREIVTLLPFFRFLANSEQSGGWIADTESAKVTFSVIGTFCLTKSENRTKKSLTQVSHYCFE